MDYQFGQFTPEHLEKIKPGIQMFNDELFFECHEFLEDLWIEDNTDNARYVYWAVIQYAVAMYHFREDNVKGVQGLLRKAKNKIEEIEKRHVETEIMERFLSWSKFKKLIKDAKLDSPLADYAKLYKFKFKNPDHWEKL